MTNAMYAARNLYDSETFNSRSEVRIRNNRLRRQRIVRCQYISLMFLITIILFSALFMRMSFMSDAQGDDYVPEIKYYSSITVHSGDTLWQIADERFDEHHYDSVDDYVNEICNINGLSDLSMVKAGENLIIPYYSSEFKK